MGDDFNLSITVFKQVILNHDFCRSRMSSTGTDADRFPTVADAQRPIQKSVEIDLVTSFLTVVIEPHYERDPTVVMVLEKAVVDSVVLPKELHPVVLMTAVWRVVAKDLRIGKSAVVSVALRASELDKVGHRIVTTVLKAQSIDDKVTT